MAEVERTEWAGEESLRPLLTALTELRPHPENARRGDVKALMASLRRFGQYRPIVALPDGTVIAGNHVMAAAQQMGWQQLAVVRADLDEREAKAALLADNRLAELGTYDDAALAGLLTDLRDHGKLDGTGYEDANLDRLLKSLQPTAPDEFPSFDEDIKTEHTCPSCGYSW